MLRRPGYKIILLLITVCFIGTLFLAYKRDLKLNGFGMNQEAYKLLAEANLPGVFFYSSIDLQKLKEDQALKAMGNVDIYDSMGNRLFHDKMSLRGHGNVSWSRDKKSWTMKFEKETSILGMNAGTDYVALANAGDYSQLRNKITLDFARDLGLQYTPNAKFALFFINDEFQGLYLITERVEVSSERVGVDIAPKSKKGNAVPFVDEDARLRGFDILNNKQNVLDTGILFREEGVLRRFEEMKCGFAMEDDNRYVEIQYPTIADRKLVEAASEYMNLVQQAIEAEDGCVEFADGSRHAYLELLDIDSYARKYLIEEITKNKDGNGNSSYYYINNLSSDPIVHAGPVWDYDIAYGNIADNAMYTSPEGLIGYKPYLDKRPEFVELVKRYYAEEFRPYALEKLLTHIDEMALQINAAVELDNKLWLAENSVHPTFQEAVDEVKDFLIARVDFLDDVWIEGKTYYRVNYVDNDIIVNTEWIAEGDSLPDYVPDIILAHGDPDHEAGENKGTFVGWFEEDMETPYEPGMPVYDDMAFWGIWE